MSERQPADEQDIWFERWLWSYLPIHWKGWAIVALTVLAGLAFIGLCTFAATLLGHPILGNLGLVIIPIMLFTGEPFIRRHSRKFI